jgi:fumarate hydratase class II
VTKTLFPRSTSFFFTGASATTSNAVVSVIASRTYRSIDEPNRTEPNRTEPNRDVGGSTRSNDEVRFDVRARTKRVKWIAFVFEPL